MAEGDGDGLLGDGMRVDGAKVGASEIFVQVSAADSNMRGFDLAFVSSVDAGFNCRLEVELP